MSNLLPAASRFLAGPFAPPYQRQKLTRRELQVYLVELLVVLATTVISFYYFFTTTTTTTVLGHYIDDNTSGLATPALLEYSANVTSYTNMTLTLDSMVSITDISVDHFNQSINEIPTTDFGLGDAYVSYQWGVGIVTKRCGTGCTVSGDYTSLQLQASLHGIADCISYCISDGGAGKCSMQNTSNTVIASGYYTTTGSDNDFHLKSCINCGLTDCEIIGDFQSPVKYFVFESGLLKSSLDEYKNDLLNLFIETRKNLSCRNEITEKKSVFEAIVLALSYTSIATSVALMLNRWLFPEDPNKTFKAKARSENEKSGSSAERSVVGEDAELRDLNSIAEEEERIRMPSMADNHES